MKKMDAIKEYAELQSELPDSEDTISFEFSGQMITNPWTDPSGRFLLSTDEAIETYGIRNFSAFTEAVSALLESAPDSEATLECMINSAHSGVIEIWRHQRNDYSARFVDENVTDRGTLGQILLDIKPHLK